VLNAATALTTRIGSIASGIQSLRTDAENRIASAVTRANELLTGIAAINAKVVSSGTQAPAPALLDERDRLVDELSKLTDLQVVDGQGGSVSLITSSGLMLFDGSSAVKLNFDGRAMLDAKAQYSTDPSQRGVGTITATTIQGSSVDAVANGFFRSGEIAAALALRDTVLPQAQRQLDELAAGLSRAVSDRQVVGTAAGGGLEIDLAGLKAGNAVTVDYTVGGVAKRVILMPTTGGAPNPIPPADAAAPNATVIRVNISGGVSAGIADVVAGFAAAGIDIVATSPVADAWRFVPNAGTTLNGVSAGVTVDTLASGVTQMPLFVDKGYGNSVFTGSFEGGSHLTGFAQRIAINPLVVAQPANLVVSGSGVLQGDPARPTFLLDALTKAQRSFSGATGIGGGVPFSSPVAEFARRIVETQGSNAEMAQRLDEGQQVARAAIESRFADYSGVNIDRRWRSSCNSRPPTARTLG
jgi:flagellar hook-associated protein 1